MINFLASKVFHDYEPCQFEPFENRYKVWLENVTDDADKTLLQTLVKHVFYLGRSEFEALYRSIFRGTISRWLIDRHSIDLSLGDAGITIKELANGAWICPVTDSLRINSFLKVTGLAGKARRPDWRSLLQFGDPIRIQQYVHDKKIVDLILLEDFVGSGEQSIPAILFAANSLPNVKILFCPLVVCPDGDTEIRKAIKKFPNITYEPCLVLPSSVMMSPDIIVGEPIIHTQARQLFDKVKGRLGKTLDQMYGHKKTGALVVFYTNCPDNTLPVFHQESGQWKPLFPRVTRGANES